MSRGWVWPVVFAVVAGVFVLTRAATRSFASLPDDTRAAYREALRRNRRPIATTGVVLAWTLTYALYSISLPLLGEIQRVVTPALSPQELAAPPTTEEPAPPAPLTVSPRSRGAIGRAPVIDEPAAPASPTDSPPVAEPDQPTKPAPCSAKALSDTVRQVQAGAEALTGRPLGADTGLLVEALAGCGGDPANAALSLLGPVYALLTDLGIPMLTLPPLPELDIPRLPEEVAAPFRSVVFPVCASVTSQLVTVSAVAPLVRLNPDDVFRALRSVLTVCQAFAPDSAA